MFIEGNITISLDDGVDPTPIIDQIRSLISATNNNSTDIHIVEVDNPVTTNPIYVSKELD
tara:strand:+ start:1749 stop:1928 length:180 start_codon:yes stop_codon:yes gene_type:complete